MTRAASRGGLDVASHRLGFKAATTEELPDAVTVMDPFRPRKREVPPVVRLAGDALNECRRRVQQDLHGHRGRNGDPLYTSRRTLHTGAHLLTEKQQNRLEKLLSYEEHTPVECTWGIYQRLIAAYRDPDRAGGHTKLSSVIKSLTTGFPAPLLELRRLGRTLSKRADDVLAYFDRPRTSNGPPKP